MEAQEGTPHTASRISDLVPCTVSTAPCLLWNAKLVEDYIMESWAKITFHLSDHVYKKPVIREIQNLRKRGKSLLCDFSSSDSYPKRWLVTKAKLYRVLRNRAESFIPTTTRWGMYYYYSHVEDEEEVKKLVQLVRSTIRKWTQVSVFWALTPHDDSLGYAVSTCVCWCQRDKCHTPGRRWSSENPHPGESPLTPLRSQVTLGNNDSKQKPVFFKILPSHFMVYWSLHLNRPCCPYSCPPTSGAASVIPSEFTTRPHCLGILNSFSDLTFPSAQLRKQGDPCVGALIKPLYQV